MLTKKQIKRKTRKIEKTKTKINQLNLIAEGYWKESPKQIIEGMFYRIEADKLSEKISSYLI